MTAKSGRLPTFFLIGASKCGTSSLWGAIGAHPDVFSIQGRQLRFFSHDEIYAHGPEWYRRQFVGAEGAAAVGENTNYYTCRAMHPETAPRMAERCPDAKLIYIVRHPLRQIESMWIQLRSQGGETHPDFSTALRRFPEIVSTANYAWQLEAYREHFSDEQILVLFAEDFAQDAAGVARRCFDFLGVDPEPDAPDAGAPARRNVSEGKRVQSGLLYHVRRVPLYRWAKGLLPARARGAIKEKLLMKRLPGRPRWKPDVREWVVGELREDSRRFLATHGKPADYWDFEEDALARAPATGGGSAS